MHPLVDQRGFFASSDRTDAGLYIRINRRILKEALYVLLDGLPGFFQVGLQVLDFLL